MTEVQPHWSEHTHEAVTHEHAHYHVTHNFFERAGAFEHLGYEHSHSHEHGSEEHAHYPHQDFDAEHAGEAHEHQHPAGSSGSAGAESGREVSESPAAAIDAALAAGGVDEPQRAAGTGKKLAAAAKKAAPAAKKAAPAAAAAAKKATGAGKKAAPTKSPAFPSKQSMPMRRPAGTAGDEGQGGGASGGPRH